MEDCRLPRRVAEDQGLEGKDRGCKGGELRPRSCLPKCVKLTSLLQDKHNVFAKPFVTPIKSKPFVPPYKAKAKAQAFQSSYQHKVDPGVTLKPPRNQLVLKKTPEDLDNLEVDEKGFAMISSKPMTKQPKISVQVEHAAAQQKTTSRKTPTPSHTSVKTKTEPELELKIKATSTTVQKLVNDGTGSSPIINKFRAMSTVSPQKDSSPLKRKFQTTTGDEDNLGGRSQSEAAKRMKK